MTIAKRIGLTMLAVLAVAVLAFAAVFSAYLTTPAYAAGETVVEDISKMPILKFSVNVMNGTTSDNPGGIYATVATDDYVDFEIIPDDANATNVDYYYLVSESSQAEGDGWNVISDRRFTYRNPEIGNSHHRFIHFRSRVTLAENSVPETYIYNEPRYIDLRFLAEPQGFAITGVSATAAGDVYDTSSSAAFTSSDIRFSLSFDITNETATDNVLFTYCLIGDDNTREWRNVVGGSIRKVDGKFSFDFEISPDFFAAEEVKAIDSRIAFRATTVTDKPLGDVYGETQEIWVRYDAEEPVFGLHSDGVDSGKYNDGVVTYYITPTDRCLSDIRYYYSLDGDPATREEIELRTSGYYVEISETSLNLTFYAVSAAGATFTVESEVLIDPVRPNIAVSAEDRELRTIENGGSARDLIKFTVKNNAANTSAVRYLYSTDGVNYRSLERDPNDSYTYNITVISSAANSYFEGTYYFKLESAAGLTSDVVVFDFTVESNVFEFRMKELDFTTDDAGWVSSVDGDGLPAIPVSLRTVTDRYTFWYSVSNRPGQFFPISVAENGTVAPSDSGQTLTL